MAGAAEWNLTIRRAIGIAVFCALFTGTSAAAEGAAEAVRWLRYASLAEIAEAYPRKAAAEGTEGHVEMACSVGADGGLFACAVDSETPTGAGFGAAALSLAPRFRADVTSLGPMPAGFWRVRIPIPFRKAAVLRC